MYIKNVDEVIVEDRLFWCKSSNLMRFLVHNKGISYVRKDQEFDKYIWIFLKTPVLDEALTEWSNNKINGTLAFAKVTK